MKRPACLMFAVLSVCLLTAAKPVHKLEAVKSAPAGLSKEIAATIDPAGQQIKGEKGAVCTIWFVKSADVKAGFKPTLAVKYPFASGQLVGAIEVAKGKPFTDFRGQEIKPGVYTLRYGKQPEDGNHIGTSELYDFILALPAKIDTSAKTLALDKLHQTSAKSAGSTHPAIFSLLPAKSDDKPGLTHNADKEHWILTAKINGSEKGKKVTLPLKMVAIGKGAE